MNTHLADPEFGPHLSRDTPTSSTSNMLTIKRTSTRRRQNAIQSNQCPQGMLNEAAGPLEFRLFEFFYSILSGFGPTMVGT